MGLFMGGDRPRGKPRRLHLTDSQALRRMYEVIHALQIERLTSVRVSITTRRLTPNALPDSSSAYRIPLWRDIWHRPKLFS
jgi:hypothetical protein